MKVFHVRFHGRPVDWIGRGRAQTVGFYKNESVLAGGEDDAVARALAKVIGGLAKHSRDIAINPDRFELEVYQVDEDLRFWHLASREGFEFYPIW